MNYREEAISFDCRGDALVGIVSLPAAQENNRRAADTGVIIIVGGPQYRAGSHRQFTLLARALAAAGHPVLRFDYRGMGDSTGGQRDFQAVNDDIGAAIGALLLHQPSLARVVLWGLCDGASAALLYMHATNDARVRGLALANPWVRSEASLARTHVKHYYLQRLRQPEFWSKALSGHVAGKALTEFWRNVSMALSGGIGQTAEKASGEQALPFTQRMALGAARSGAELLLTISGNDLTAKEFEDHARDDIRWREALDVCRTTVLHIADADHTFSHRRALEALLDGTIEWMSTWAARSALFTVSSQATADG